MTTINDIITADFGSLEGTEIVSLGHPDMKSAYLAAAGREFVEQLQKERGWELLASDIKVLLGGEIVGDRIHPTITVDGNVGRPPGFSREEFNQYCQDIGNHILKVSDEIGYSTVKGKESDASLDTLILDPSKVILNVGLLPQSSELRHNLADHSSKPAEMPNVFGDGVWITAGANLETPELLRAEIVLARKINERLVDLVDTGYIHGGYDGKVHVVGEGHWDKESYKVRVVQVVKQHDINFKGGARQTHDYVQETVLRKAVIPVLGDLYNEDVLNLFNSAGEWNHGGSLTDMGEGCDHIFWAQMGYAKYADPQVGEDQTKADNVEFWARAISKTALEMLKDYGVYEVRTKALTHIQSTGIVAYDMDFRDRDEKQMFDPQLKKDIYRVLFSTGMFPLDAIGIMKEFVVPATEFMNLLRRGNIYGYSAEDAQNIPWENVDAKIELGKPMMDQLMQSYNISTVETNGTLISAN